MSCSDDRWTCPHLGCTTTVIANPEWQREVRIRYVRQARDLHAPVCTALVRVRAS